MFFSDMIYTDLDVGIGGGVEVVDHARRAPSLHTVHGVWAARETSGRESGGREGVVDVFKKVFAEMAAAESKWGRGPD